jgi:site-specific recombinase XerD
LITAYLDCSAVSTSPFKALAAETRRTRRNILENFGKAHGDLPIYQIVNGKRVLLLTREHMQHIVNKSGHPVRTAQFFHTLRAMFQWAMNEGRVPDDPTLGVKRVTAKTTCRSRKSDPRVVMVQSGQNWHGNDRPASLNSSS